MVNPSDTTKTPIFQDADQIEAPENSVPESSKPHNAAGQKEQRSSKDGATNAADIREPTEVLRNATLNVAKQSAEVIRLSFRAVAEVQAPLVEVSHEHSRRLVDRIAHVTDIYYDAAQQTSPKAHALVESFYAFSLRLQQTQNANLALARSSMDGLFRGREKLSHVNSAAEFAKFQSDIYLDTVNTLFKNYTTFLQNMTHITQDTLHPLKEPAQH
jgi:hypothetical protein